MDYFHSMGIKTNASSVYNIYVLALNPVANPNPYVHGRPGSRVHYDRGGQSQEERAAAAIYFNNPDSPSPVVDTA